MKLQVWFRWTKKNSYSISALMPLIKAELSREPRPGIMLYSFATIQAEEIYQEVSNAKVDAIYIAGGPHPSAVPEQVLEYFDYVVIGEGEASLPKLIEALKRKEDPGKVNGIAYKKDGKVRFTLPREPVDLDLYTPFRRPLLAPLEISRGCPWACAYCQTPRLFGSKMRHRSISMIAKYARCHNDIRFTSPNSLAYGSNGLWPSLEKVELLLKTLSELNRPIYFGTFPSEVRPEFVSHEALELIVDYCSNKSLSIGAQSGSPRVLEAIYRGHSVEQIELACDLCNNHGLTPQVDLMFGLPTETKEDQHLTINLAKRIIQKGGKVRAHRFMPLPGTPLANTIPSPIDKKVEAKLGQMALEGNLKGNWS